jgi:DNA topoisomerase IB
MSFREAWWDLANCRGRHDLVDRFPVKRQCYVDGYMDAYAVRGGTTAAQRQADRSQRRSLDVRSG